MLSQLPTDCIHYICSYIDSFSGLAQFRASCVHLYEASLESDWFFGSMEGVNRDIFMYDSQTTYEEFFEYWLHKHVLSNETSLDRYNTFVFRAIMKGAVVSVEQYGWQQSRFIYDLFFKSMFIALDRGRDDTPALREMLTCMKNYEGLWHALDYECVVFPRSATIQLFRKYRGTQRLGEILRLLHENGFYLDMHFAFASYDEEKERDVIPIVSVCFSLFHLAVWLDDIEATKVLAELGLSVNRVDAHHRTPLHYSVTNQCLNRVSEWLINEPSIEPFLEDNTGASACYLAQLYHNEEIIELLKQRFGTKAVEDNISAVTNSMKLLELNPLNVEEHQNDEEEWYDSESDFPDGTLQLLHDLEEYDEHSLANRYTEENRGHKVVRKVLNVNHDARSHSDYSDYESDCDAEEEGLSSKFVMNNGQEEVREAISLFERLDRGDWSDELYDYTHQVLHVEPFPRRDVQNPPAKRKREDSELVEDQKLVAKRARVEKVGDGLIDRSSLVIPKHPCRRLIRGELLNFRTDISMSSLAFFLIQSAMESRLQTLFTLAQEYASFFRRDFVSQVDLKAAVLRLDINKQRPVPKLDDGESDALSHYSCSIGYSREQSDISYDNVRVKLYDFDGIMDGDIVYIASDASSGSLLQGEDMVDPYY